MPYEIRTGCIITPQIRMICTLFQKCFFPGFCFYQISALSECATRIIKIFHRVHCLFLVYLCVWTFPYFFVRLIGSRQKLLSLPFKKYILAIYKTIVFKLLPHLYKRRQKNVELFCLEKPHAFFAFCLLLLKPTYTSPACDDM